MLALVRNLGCQLRCRFRAQDGAHAPSVVRRTDLCENRLASDLAAAPFFRVFSAVVLHSLPHGETQQRFPQVVPILDTRKTSCSQPLTETVERAQRRIFFVHDAAAVAELAAGTRNELRVVPFPDLLGRQLDTQD